MSALFELVNNRQWQVAISHIQSLADGDVVEKLSYQQYGYTALI